MLVSDDGEVTARQQVFWRMRLWWTGRLLVSIEEVAMWRLDWDSGSEWFTLVRTFGRYSSAPSPAAKLHRHLLRLAALHCGVQRHSERSQLLQVSLCLARVGSRSECFTVSTGQQYIAVYCCCCSVIAFILECNHDSSRELS